MTLMTRAMGPRAGAQHEHWISPLSSSLDSLSSPEMRKQQPPVSLEVPNLTESSPLLETIARNGVGNGYVCVASLDERRLSLNERMLLARPCRLLRSLVFLRLNGAGSGEPLFMVWIDNRVAEVAIAFRHLHDVLGTLQRKVQRLPGLSNKQPEQSPNQVSKRSTEVYGHTNLSRR